MKGFLIALSFLTRLRITVSPTIKANDSKQAVYYFPLVGLGIGIIIYLVALAGRSIFNPLTIAILILLVEVVLTGGLHLDGLIDTCDGCFSGQERTKVLEIMRDSRIGSMGAIALSFILMVKWACLYELLTDISLHLDILILMPLVGRWAMTYVIILFPSARQEGMGVLFKSNLKSQSVLYISLYCLVLISIYLHYSNVYFASGLGQSWLIVITTLVFTGGLSIYIAHIINQRLGGHTGDTYGAINELTEIIFLVSYLFFVHLPPFIPNF